MSSGSEIEEYALVESIVRARAEEVKGQLAWRYNVKWVGRSMDENSWLYDDDFSEQTMWIIDKFWANIEGGIDQQDYSEGDFVYAKQVWLDELARARAKQAAQQKPRRRRKLVVADSDEDSDAFFRRKQPQPKKTRSSPPTRTFKATPLKQQKLDFSKAASSAKAADSSPSVASSSRLTQTKTKSSKDSTPAIIISSSSEDDTPTRPPPPAAAGKPSRPQKLSAASNTSQPASNSLTRDSQRRSANGSATLAGGRPIRPHPGRLRTRSPSVTERQSNGVDGTRLTSSPVLSRPTALPATGHPKKGSLRPVAPTFHKSPPPRSELLAPTVSTPTQNGVPAPPSAEAVVDLCTPSPEPPRQRAPSPPRTSAPKPKRPNPFASFAFDPSAHGPANGRPAKKRRLDADNGPASSLPAPAAGPVSPQAFRARNDFKSSRPSSSKTAAAVTLAKEPTPVVDLTASDEPPATQVPGHSRTSSSGEFVPNGLLGSGRQRLTPPPRQQPDVHLDPRTPSASRGSLQASTQDENVFASPIHSWSSPAVRSLVEHSPLRPNGLLSSAAKSEARGVGDVERTPLRPNGLLSSPTSAFPRNGIRHDDTTPLRPNGLLGASSSPVIEVHSSPIVKRSDELPSYESEEDEEPFFRQPRPKTSAKTKQKSKSPPVSPTADMFVEPEIVGPESYRVRMIPKLGRDEIAMPESYRPSFVLELGPGYTIPVRLRDVAAGHEFPQFPSRLSLHRARMYDSRHAPKLVRAAGAGRVVPDPRTTSRPAASSQECAWFLEFYRRLVDGNKFIVLHESGEMGRGLVILSTQNWEPARKLWIPDGMRRYRHCIVVAKISASDLAALPPQDEIFTFDRSS